MSTPTERPVTVYVRVEMTIRRPGGHTTTIDERIEVRSPAKTSDADVAAKALDQVTSLVKGRVE
jgi:hypothetical protein